MRGDVSVKVAARFFKMSEVTITRKCQAKVFPNSFQVGDKHCTWYIPADDLLSFYPNRERGELMLEALIEMFEK